MGCKPFPFVPRPSAHRPLKYFAALAPAKFPFAPLGRNTLLEPFPLPLDPLPLDPRRWRAVDVVDVVDVVVHQVFDLPSICFLQRHKIIHIEWLKKVK